MSIPYSSMLENYITSVTAWQSDWHLHCYYTHANRLVRDSKIQSDDLQIKSVRYDVKHKSNLLAVWTKPRGAYWHCRILRSLVVRTCVPTKMFSTYNKQLNLGSLIRPMRGLGGQMKGQSPVLLLHQLRKDNLPQEVRIQSYIAIIQCVLWGSSICSIWWCLSKVDIMMIHNNIVTVIDKGDYRNYIYQYQFIHQFI